MTETPALDHKALDHKTLDHTATRRRGGRASRRRQRLRRRRHHATFADDALVNDAHREFWGAEAIRRWVAREMVGDRVTHRRHRGH